MLRGLACLLLLLLSGTASADYPQIRRLSSDDVLFKQLQSDLEGYFRAISRGLPALKGVSPTAGAPAVELPPLRFFSVLRPQNMDLFALAARLNLPYDTLASLNGLDSPGDLDRRQEMIVPNMPGLFVPERPASTFQDILASMSSNTRSGAMPVVVLGAGGGRRFLFFPGQGFLAVERAFFLNILFRFPLPLGQLTSAYGSRPDPLTGSPEFHHGVDIGAPPGTEVYAARDGQVAEVGEDPQLGRLVVIEHEGGYQTVYGHLNEIRVALNQSVRSGMIVGTVGTTGYTTGPHLHFEIHRYSKIIDPLKVMKTR